MRNEKRGKGGSSDWSFKLHAEHTRPLLDGCGALRKLNGDPSNSAVLMMDTGAKSCLCLELVVIVRQGRSRSVSKLLL
jgi:hypothetical protein